ncbi:DUF2179 domain-containing protein [Halalkalibacter okhensis]|uniref:UPF0316 protein LQ50_15205 n=1 Tax=Halalkalibacter okhensis TaxID=333138 RepID=A0A0B0IEY4_9BACI|nr:DUF2179 domain-containing protein [Halalkalibacter okhensis]KHF39407.1 hypothetical protein LQ50_15205 [Halalkalibacter okhensis]
MKEILLIIILQLIYVPIFTLRTIFVVKGMSVIAAQLAVIEGLVYVFGLSIVLSGNPSTIAMFVYAVGFGIGILLGAYVERKLAIGYTSLIVNLERKNEELISFLRNEGFGVTVFEGEGKESKRYQLELLTKRSREDELMNLIEEYEPKAFIISYEPRKFKGGFLVKAMKRTRRKKEIDKE